MIVFMYILFTLLIVTEGCYVGNNVYVKYKNIKKIDKIFDNWDKDDLRNKI